MIDWVIQTDIFDKEENNKLISSIIKSGAKCKLVDKNAKPFTSKFNDFFDNGDFYIFRGSLENKKYLDLSKDFFMNVYEDLSAYNWSNYAPTEDVLNSDYIIIPSGSVKKNRELICDTFSGDQLFLKPNDGCKLFTGTTLKKKWFDKEIDIIFGDAIRKVQHNDLIIFSSFKNVVNEVRVVMIENEVITYGIYNGEVASYMSKGKWVNDAISNLKINYPPNPIYTVDLCLDSGKIIEINSFCCAGLYMHTDYDILVNRINNFYMDE
jgi:hypothetical protein